MLATVYANTTLRTLASLCSTTTAYACFLRFSLSSALTSRFIGSRLSLQRTRYSTHRNGDSGGDRCPACQSRLPVSNIPVIREAPHYPLLSEAVLLRFRRAARYIIPDRSSGSHTSLCRLGTWIPELMKERKRTRETGTPGQLQQSALKFAIGIRASGSGRLEWE
jgi:hypothetical protein